MKLIKKTGKVSREIMKKARDKMKKIWWFIILTFSGATTLSGATHIIGRASGTWSPENNPYIITDEVTVDSGAVLRILPGTVVKLGGVTARLRIKGRLAAVGTEDSAIVFTSLADDSYCGDDNGDGNASTPAPGDWGYIVCEGYNPGQADTLRHCVVKYGGADEYWPRPMVILGSYFYLVEQCHISRSAGDGIFLCYVDYTEVSKYRGTVSRTVRDLFGPKRPRTCNRSDSARGEVNNCTVSYNAGDGIICQAMGTVLILGNQVSGNGQSGIVAWAMSQGLVLENNSVQGNAICGIRAEETYQYDNNDVRIAYFVPLVRNNILDENGQGVPLFLSLRGHGLASGNSISAKALGLCASLVDSNTVLRRQNLPYLLDGQIAIDSTGRLEVEAGVAIACRNGSLDCQGRLVAKGTQLEPIILTSCYDDSILGGAFAGQPPQPGDWGGIILRVPESGPGGAKAGAVRKGGQSLLSGADTLMHCLIRYGQGIECRDIDSSLISHCRISHNAGSGIYFGYQGAMVDVIQNEICDNGDYGIFYRAKGYDDIVQFRENIIAGHQYGIYLDDLDVLPLIEDNTFFDCGYALHIGADQYARLSHNNYTLNIKGIFIRGEVWHDCFWENPGIPLVCQGLYINNGVRWSLGPGTIIKVNQSDEINIYGRLVALGTEQSPIVFTSVRDDSLGGDSDGNYGSPQPGDWWGLNLLGAGNDSLKHCRIKYGGRYHNYPYYRRPALYWRSPFGYLDSCLIERSLTDGLRCEGTGLKINGTTFRDCSENGLRIQDVSPIISRSRFAGNACGILCSNASPSIHDNIISGNSQWGLFNQSSDRIVDAAHNWWGHASGPYDPSPEPPDSNPGGQGDRVSDYIAYRPWSDSAALVKVTLLSPPEGAILDSLDDANPSMAGIQISVIVASGQGNTVVLAVNGQSLDSFLLASDTLCCFQNVTLAEGINRLSVEARDALGHSSYAVRDVLLDTYNYLSINSPAEDSLKVYEVLSINGSTKPLSRVWAVRPVYNDTIDVRADQNGAFSFFYSPPWEGHALNIYSVSPGGKMVQKTLFINRQYRARIYLWNKEYSNQLNIGRDSVDVVLYDYDEYNTDSVRVMLWGTISHDSECVFLNKTPWDGEFKNTTSLPLLAVNNCPTINNGILEVREGEIISVLYIDDDDPADIAFANASARDTIPPAAPENLAAQPQAGGTIKLTWRPGPGEVPSRYEIYRARLPFSDWHQAIFCGSTNGACQATVYPPDDSLYYYAAFAYDASNNISPASNCVSAVSDRTGPAAAITLAPRDTLDIGRASVFLATNEPTRAVPNLQYRSQYGSWVSIPLSGSGTEFNGFMEITDQSGDGLAEFKFSAQDSLGNNGNVISSGGEFVIETRSPSAAITTNPGSPLTVGPIAVQVSASESLALAPVLQLISASGQAVAFSLSGRGRLWSGTAAIPTGFGDGQAQFHFAGQDASGKLGTQIHSGASVLIDALAPAAPDSFRGRSLSGGRIALNWRPGPGEPSARFKIYRSLEPLSPGDNLDSTASLITSVSASSYSDLPPGDSLYYYAVVARDAAGNWSQPSVIGPIVSDRTAPAAPANPTATRGSGNNVIIRWQPAATEPVVYDLYRSLSPIASLDGRTPLQANLSDTLAVDQLAGSATYYYAIVAKDITGNRSPIASCPPLSFDLVPPTASLTTFPASPVKAGLLKIMLQASEPLWETPSLELVSGNGLSYLLSLRDSAGAYWTEMEITEATGDGNGFFAFQGRDLAGNVGTTISSGKNIIIDTRGPAVITNFEAAAGPGGTVRLSWSPPEGESSIDYKIYRKQVPDTTGLEDSLLATTNRLVHTDSTAEDRIYYYWVAGVDRLGNQGRPSPARAAVSDRIPPRPPENLSADTSLLPAVWLAWSPPAGDSLRFDLYRNGALYRNDIAANGCSDTLIFQRDYIYHLVARDLAGNTSLPSAGKVVWYDRVPPEASITLSPASPVGTRGALVTLTASEDLAEVPGLNFTPQGGPSINLNLSGGPRVWHDSLRIMPATPEGTAIFRFQGRDQAGNLGTSISSGATFFIDTTPPAAPQWSLVRAGRGGRVMLSWSAAAGASAYDLYRSTDSLNVTSDLNLIKTGATGTSYLDITPLDTIYYYALIAVDAAGNRSVPSGSARVISDRVPPPPPLDLSAQLGNNQVLLTWAPSVGAQRYRIYRASSEIIDLTALEPAASSTDTFFSDVPNFEGAVYYAVTALDSADNESPASANASINWDITGPSAIIALDPPPPYSWGQVTITLTTSEPVIAAPLLQLCPDSGTSIPISLAGSGRVWSGSLDIGGNINEGWAQFSYSATDGSGNTGSTITAGSRFLIDRTPPPAPYELSARSLSAGQVKLVWVPDPLDPPRGYNIYRDTVDITSLEGRTPYRSNYTPRTFMETPLEDRRYFYAVQTIDLAGNVGSDFRKASVVSDRISPEAMTSLSATVMANGRVCLAWPKHQESHITYTLYRRQCYFQDLAGLTPLAIGIPDTLVEDIPPTSGNYYYVVTAVDASGNESSASPCVGVFSDVVPPTAAITISPPSPVRSGTIRICLTASEPLASPPSLSFRPAGGQLVPIMLDEQNGQWYGQFEINNNMNSGQAWFYFSGTDSAGNTGQNITRGASFNIDNQAPSPIINLRAISGPGGIIKLSYQYNDFQAGACSTQLYISEQPIDDISGLTPILTEALHRPLDFLPPEDGWYYLAATVSDSAGNQSPIFDCVRALSDRTPPLAPDTCRIQVGEANIAVSWSAVEEGLIYQLYRDTLPQFAVMPNKKVAEDLRDTIYYDLPPRPGNYYYALVPKDAVGNVGSTVYSPRAAFTATLPSAEITLSPASPLRTDALVTVVVAESLSVPPRLSCKIKNTVTNISLSGQGCVWTGTLNIRQAGQGKAQFLYSATDPLGRTSHTITSGEFFTIDTIPPTVSLELRPESPVSAGQKKVYLWPSEPLASAELAFTPMGGVGQAVPLADSGRYWTGIFAVTPQMNDGTAYFSFLGTDSAGNLGTRIGSGATFIIDNTPPTPPGNIKAVSRPGGRIDLSWLPTGSDVIKRYAIYRAPHPFSDTCLAERIKDTTVTNYTDLPDADGQYYYAVVSINTCGLASLPSANAVANSDRLAPGAATSLATSVLPGKVRLSWEPPLGEMPHHYLIVRQQGGRRDTLGLVADSLSFVDRPILDGHYIYYIASFDSVGNGSQPAQAACDFVQTLPVARITLTPPSPVRNGQPIQVLLRTSKRLVSTPELRFKPEKMEPVPVAPLTWIDDSTWAGSFSVTPQTGDGPARFFFTGQDSAGNVGTGIAQGDTFTIDTQGPEAYITISPTSPVRAGLINVFLRTRERLAQPPYLDYQPSGRPAIRINLTGSDTLWQGQFTVTPATGEGLAIFHYEGVDLAGIATNLIAQGKFFSIDTEAPPAPEWITATPQLEGGIKIKWQVPRGLLDRSYKIYRTTQPLTSIAGLTPLKIIESLGRYNPFDDYYLISDDPSMDGVYYYAVTGIDSAGNEGSFVQSQPVRCDRVPPHPPTGLVVVQIPNGSLKFTWNQPTGEVPFYYNVYCSESPLTTTIGAAKIGDHIPWNMVYGCPEHDGHYYFAVTAVDTAGNESALSQIAEFNFVNYPPKARIKLRPTNWLKTGNYQVSLTTNEELDSCFLSYTPLNQGPKIVDLQGSGCSWVGNINITDADSNGAAYFTWRGVSTTGEVGHLIYEGEYFVIDHNPPLAVESLQVRPVGNVGGLEVSWKVPLGETPRYYRLYRSTQPIADTLGLIPVWEKRIDTLWTYLKHVDIPPMDGWYHYAVMSADLAGNWGPLCASDSGLSTRQAPTATIKLYTAYSGDRWTNRVGLGQVRVVLQPSEPLAGAPILKYAVAGDDSQQVILSDSAGWWIGTIEVTGAMPNGTAGFGFYGQDLQGYVGTEIVFGREFTVNTEAPVAEVIIPEIYKMRPDVFRNRLVTRPLRAGTWPVKLTTTAPLFNRPQFFYTPLGSADSSQVMLNGFAEEWIGQLVVPQDAVDTTYVFSWQGQDREGNWGVFIDSVRYDYDYYDEPDLNGIIHRHIVNTYATTGGRFQVDTRPPGTPRNVRLEARQAGVAVIYWDHPEGELPGGYDLYRDIYPITASSIGRLAPIKKDVMALIAVDDPPVDGTYYYAVRAVDLAGNQGPISESPSVFIDSWKPEIRYTAVPADGFIVLRAQSTEALINFNCVLTFPGQGDSVILGGENGTMAIPHQIIQRSPTEWDIVIMPQQVNYFNGEIEVRVLSPDISGNITRSSAGIAVEPITPSQGGSLQSTDGMINVTIPPGFVPIIPGGPQIPNALNREHLFFIVCERMEGIDERVPRESEPAQTIDLSRVHPGLKLVGVPYTISIGSEPGEPEFIFEPGSYGGGIPDVGPTITWQIPPIRDQYNDTSYMRRKIRPYKWRPEHVDTATGLMVPGRWEVIRDCVQFADSNAFILPVTTITKYALFAELKPPKVMSCMPNEATVLHSYQPEIRIEVEDFGTGIDPSSVELKIDGVVVPHQYQEIDPWKGIITYIPPQPLVGNSHTAQLRVEDVVENACVHQWMFFIDVLPPTIASLLPADSSFTGQIRPVVSCVVEDVGGGVDSNRVSLLCDGQRVAARYDANSGRITFLPATLIEGWHTVRAEAYDNAGMKAERQWRFAVDTSGPRVEQLSPACSACVNGSWIRVGFRLCDSLSGLWPDSTQLLIDGTPRLLSHSESQQWFFTDTLALDEGWHLARMRGSDRLGNLAERIWSFGVDRTPPAIVKRGPDSVTVSGIVLLLELRDSIAGIDTTAISMSIDGRPVTDVHFDRTTGELLAFADSLEGWQNHLAEITVSDRAGNYASFEWQIVSSGGYTGISDMQPLPGSIINNSRPTISAKIKNDSAVPRMYLDGNLVAADYDSLTRVLSYSPSEALASGEHLAMVEADSGNLEGWRFAIDDLPPTFGECLPSGISGCMRPIIAVRCYDDGAGLNPATARLRLDGAVVGISYDSLHGRFLHQPPQPLAPGSHRIDFSVNDRAGNNTQRSWSFGIDTTLVEFTDFRPEPGTFCNQPRPAISFRTVAAVPDSSIRMEVDWQEVAVTRDSLGRWYGLLSGPLAEGNHLVFVSAQDNMGRMITSSWLFHSDTTAPMALEVLPGSGAVTSNRTPLLAVRWLEKGSGLDSTSCILSLDGILRPASCDTATGTIRYQPAAALSCSLHTVMVQVADRAGNQGRCQWTFLVDDDQPRVVEVAPLPNSYIVDPQPWITVRLSQYFAVHRPETLAMYLDGLPVVAVYDSQECRLRYRPAENLCQGTHRVIVSAVSDEGLQAREEWQFVIDSQGPVIANLRPTNGAFLSSHRPLVSARVTDGNLSLTPSIFLDGIELVTTYDPISGLVWGRPGSPLAPGSHRAVIMATDLAGTSDSASSAFSVNQLPSIFSGHQPAHNTYTNQADAILIQTRLPLSELMVDSLRLYLDEDLKPVQIVDRDSGALLNYIPTSPLAEGRHLVSCRVLTRSGISEDLDYLFTVDRTGPEISQIWPREGSFQYNTRFTISARLKDLLSGIRSEQIALLLDSVPLSVQFHRTAGMATASGLELGPGTHRATLTVYDRAGNQACAQWSFTMTGGGLAWDRQQPAPDTVLANPRPTISARCQIGNGPGIDSVFLWVDDLQLQPSYDPTTGVLYSTVDRDLRQGGHRALALAVDSAGQETSTEWYFSVDTQGPVIHRLWPEPGGIAASTKPVIWAMLSDTGSGIDPHSLLASVDGRSLMPVYNEATGCLIAQVQEPLADGLHGIYIRAGDLAGRTAEYVGHFLVDAEAPLISNPAPAPGAVLSISQPNIGARIWDQAWGGNVGPISLQLDANQMDYNFDPVQGTISGICPQALDDGWHFVNLSVSDSLGRRVSQSWFFGLDTRPPAVSGFTPSPGCTVTAARPLVAAVVVDSVSAIDPSSLAISIDSISVGARYDSTSGRVLAQLHFDLNPGRHRVDLTAGDRAGNSISASWYFETAPMIWCQKWATANAATGTGLAWLNYKWPGQGNDSLHLLSPESEARIRNALAATGRQWNIVKTYEDFTLGLRQDPEVIMVLGQFHKIGGQYQDTLTARAENGARIVFSGWPWCGDVSFLAGLMFLGRLPHKNYPVELNPGYISDSAVTLKTKEKMNRIWPMPGSNVTVAGRVKGTILPALAINRYGQGEVWSTAFDLVKTGDVNDTVIFQRLVQLAAGGADRNGSADGGFDVFLKLTASQDTLTVKIREELDPLFNIVNASGSVQGNVINWETVLYPGLEQVWEYRAILPDTCLSPRLVTSYIDYLDQYGSYRFYGSVPLTISNLRKTSLHEYLPGLPAVYALGQVYPNPVSGRATIFYQLPEPARIRITIYNVLGQAVKTLVDQHQPAGYYSVSWNSDNDRGSKVAAGTYLYRMEAGGKNRFRDTKKLIRIK